MANGSDRLGVFLRRLELRDRVSDEERDTLVAGFEPSEVLPAQAIIAADGSRPTKSVLMLSGLSARTRTLKNGERQIVALHVPGDFVDLHSFLVKTMDHDVVALAPCTIARLPHSHLQRITERLPHLARLLWLLTLIDAAIFREWAAGLGVRNASQRMAHLFCELHARLKAVGLTVDSSFSFPVSQVDLKDMLGLSAVHTNRTLMDLRQRNLISWDKGVARIVDLVALKELALFDEDYLHLRSEAR